MNEVPHCPECGANLPANLPTGLCSRCAFQAALGESRPENLSTVTPRQVFGDYELLEEIARGGMGVVYRGRQISLNRIVAVKLLLSGKYAGEDFIKRFQVEATAAASLQHPNIVAIHHFGVHEGHHYLAMDLVTGANLAELVQKQPLTATRAAGYVKTIAEAIDFAHSRRILHRDLKPSNVLIDSNDQPRVTDFGLAKNLSSDSDLTLSGEIYGSPSFMPPEQACGQRGKVSEASDVYSLGAILYYLLTSRPPFGGSTLGETFQQIRENEPVAPRTINATVPRDLETICLKCLQKEPERRYKSARQLAEELGRFIRQEPILARPVSYPEKAWLWCQRKPAVAGLSAVALLAMLIGLAGLLIAQRNKAIADDAAGKARDILHASDLVLINLALKETNLTYAPEILQGLERAIRNRPNDPVLWHARGTMLEKTNGFEAALQHFSASYSLAKTNSSRDAQTQALSSRSKLLRRLGRLPEAARDYCTAKGVLLPGYGKSTAPEALPNFTEAEQLTVELGPTNTATGLHSFDVSDGRSEAVQLDGKPCRTLTRMQGGVAYSYFFVDPTFKWTCGSDVLVQVEYFDASGGTFGIEYDGITNAFAQSRASVRLEGSQKWKEASFLLERVRFDSRQNGHADFRIWARGVQLAIHRVTVSKCNPETLVRSALESMARRKTQGGTNSNGVAEGKIDAAQGSSLAEIEEALQMERTGRLTNAYAALTKVLEYLEANPGQRPGLQEVVLLNRAALLRRLNRLDESGADNIKALKIPPRDIQMGPDQIDLSVAYNYELTKVLRAATNSPKITTIPEDIQRKTGIRYDVRGLVALASMTPTSHIPGTRQQPVFKESKNIPVHRRFKYLHVLHGTSKDAPDGNLAGSYVLHYADGRKAEIPIVYGQDLRNWWGWRDELEPSRATLAWTEAQDAPGFVGAVRLYEITRENPYPDTEVTHLDFIGGKSQCGLFLFAISVEEETADSARFWARKADDAAAGGDYKKALTELDKGLNRLPQSMLLWQRKGRYLLRAKQYREALPALEQAIQLLDKDPAGNTMLLTEARLDLAATLSAMGRWEEAALANLEAHGIPPRDSTLTPQMLDLSLNFNYELLGNLGVRRHSSAARRMQSEVFASTGILFDLRGMIALGGLPGSYHLPEAEKQPKELSNTGIPVRRRCQQLHFLHGTSKAEKDNKVIAQYVLHYADGTQATLPIVYGRDLRNWWGDKQSGASEARLAWSKNRRALTYTAPVKLYQVTKQNPHPDLEITSMDFVSTGTECAPFLIAVTLDD